MKQRWMSEIKYLAIFLVLCVVAASVAAGTKAETPKTVPVPSGKFANFNKVTRLVIIPPYRNLRIKPGDSANFSVKIKNPTDKDVLITPKVVISPYSENAINSSWISFDKQKFTLKAKKEAEINVTVKVPEDVEKGYYFCSIAFTNDTFPVTTPYGIPRYVNVLHLSVNVWIPPSVRIGPRYISDVVQSGKSYEYTVRIVNTANRSFTLHPELTSQEYPSIYTTPLSKNSVKIEAPSTIPPHSGVSVKIKVSVPETAKGVLNGIINLNINDPGLDKWSQQVTLNLRVFTQPAKPFVKLIRVDNASKLTIKVSTGINLNIMGAEIPVPLFYGTGNFKQSRANVSVNIVSPSGAVKVKPKTIERLVVTTGGISPPWEETGGIYKVVAASKTKIYSIKNPENGVWKLEITPENCFGFSVEVDIE